MTDTLEGEDAIALWKEGSERWNDWAHLPQNKNCAVSFANHDFSKDKYNVDFEGFIFPATVSFFNCSFGDGLTDFSCVKFGIEKGLEKGLEVVDFGHTKFGNGYVDFRDTIFKGERVSFEYAKFGDCTVNFSKAIFESPRVNFGNATFGKGNVYFVETIFGEEGISFIYAAFGEGTVIIADCNIGNGNFYFHGCSLDTLIFEPEGELQFAPHFTGLYVNKSIVLDNLRIAPLKYFSDDNASIYRTLKKLASQSHNQTQELEFFAEEMRAKYYQHKWKRYFIWVWWYDHVSNFGRSIIRPIYYWFLLLAIFTPVYWSHSTTVTGTKQAAFSLSLSNMLSLLPYSRTIRENAIEALYKGSPGLLVDLLGVTQGLLSLTLLFLIGLAFRNKLRL